MFRKGDRVRYLVIPQFRGVIEGECRTSLGKTLYHVRLLKPHQSPRDTLLSDASLLAYDVLDQLGREADA